MTVQEHQLNKEKYMKKFAPLCFVLAVLFIGLSGFSTKHHKHTPTPKYEGQDSTKQHPKDKKHPHVGGSVWNVAIMVVDAVGKPFNGATVALPCTGGPAKTTGTSGKVVFSGNAPCPCGDGQATVSTPKGCIQTISVICDSSYTVPCTY